MLDQIPLRRASWVVTDRDTDPQRVRQALQLPLPQPNSPTVAATAVAFNSQAPRPFVVLPPVKFPPTADAGHREVGRCGAQADKDQAVIRQRIEHPKRRGLALGIAREVVHVHVFRSGSPSLAVVLEVSDQLAVLGIDADDRVAAFVELGACFQDLLELFVAIGMGLSGQPFFVGSQGNLHVAEQASDGIRRDNADSPGERLQAAADVADSSFWVTAGFGLDNVFELLLDVGRFFSTRGRPPPGFRTRSSSG